MGPTRRGTWATIAVFVWAGAVSVGARDPGTPELMRVRTSSPRVASLLADGAALSPTFAALLAGLERTHWRVFIDLGACPRESAFGCLLDGVGRFTGDPYVRIRINDSRLRDPRRQISALAHELQHALEVAEAPDVATTADVAALFRRIGYVHARSGHLISYETEAAQRVGHRVLKELQLGGPGSRQTEP